MGVVYVLLGPTASGKTDVAVELAGLLGAELASLDSMKVYRGMNIGTAKPRGAEIKGSDPFTARGSDPFISPRWHLLDLADPTEDFNVGRWLAAADAAIAEAAARGMPLVFEGGAPLYSRALIEGLFAGPARSPELRAEIRKRAEAEGVERLHAELAAVDPAAAARILPGDLRRIERALEVWKLTGRPISELQTQAGRRRTGFDFRVAGIERDRQELYARINARVDAMMAAGFLEEVRGLAARYGRLSAGAMQALGYRELSRHLAGEIALEEAVDQTKRHTRHFARRQIGAFRRIKGVEFFTPNAGESAAELARRIAARLNDKGGSC